jgi:hypothetical protein
MNYAILPYLNNAHRERLENRTANARRFAKMDPSVRLQYTSALPDPIPMQSPHIQRALAAIEKQLAEAAAEIRELTDSERALLPPPFLDRRARTAFVQDLKFIYKQRLDALPQLNLDPYRRAFRRIMHYRYLACRAILERTPSGPRGTLALRSQMDTLLRTAVTEKRCPACCGPDERLPASSFHLCRTRRDGLQGYCRRCLLSRNRDNEQARRVAAGKKPQLRRLRGATA